MNRRAFLVSVAVGGLAGCSEVPGSEGASPTPTPAVGAGLSLAERGSPASVCERDVVDLGINAIVEPAFGDGRIEDDQVVVGIASGGHARAYPLSVLSRVEVVNERFPDGSDVGRPLLVTYCPVCRSGMVAERRVGGEPVRFGVSGQVWEPPDVELGDSERSGRVFAAGEDDPDGAGRVKRDGALVMYDAATGSFWSQPLARAICGPLRGSELTVVPSTTALWGEWRHEHPDTEVLLPFPESKAANPPVPGAGTPTPREPE